MTHKMITFSDNKNQGKNIRSEVARNKLKAKLQQKNDAKLTMDIYDVLIKNGIDAKIKFIHKSKLNSNNSIVLDKI